MIARQYTIYEIRYEEDRVTTMDDSTDHVSDIAAGGTPGSIVGGVIVHLAGVIPANPGDEQAGKHMASGRTLAC